MSWLLVLLFPGIPIGLLLLECYWLYGPKSDYWDMKRRQK